MTRGRLLQERADHLAACCRRCAGTATGSRGRTAGLRDPRAAQSRATRSPRTASASRASRVLLERQPAHRRYSSASFTTIVCSLCTSTFAGARHRAATRTAPGRRGSMLVDRLERDDRDAVAVAQQRHVAHAVHAQQRAVQRHEIDAAALVFDGDAVGARQQIESALRLDVGSAAAAPEAAGCRSPRRRCSIDRAAGRRRVAATGRGRSPAAAAPRESRGAPGLRPSRSSRWRRQARDRASGVARRSPPVRDRRAHVSARQTRQRSSADVRARAGRGRPATAAPSGASAALGRRRLGDLADEWTSGTAVAELGFRRPDHRRCLAANSASALDPARPVLARVSAAACAAFAAATRRIVASMMSSSISAAAPPRAAEHGHSERFDLDGRGGSGGRSDRADSPASPPPAAPSPRRRAESSPRSGRPGSRWSSPAPISGSCAPPHM